MLMYPEPLVPRREIPKLVRKMTRGAKQPHEQTVRRWYRQGFRCRGGRVIKLEVRYIGGAVFTTPAWLREFFEQRTLESSQVVQETPTNTASLNRVLVKDYAAVNAEMEAAGL